MSKAKLAIRRTTSNERAKIDRRLSRPKPLGVYIHPEGKEEIWTTERWNEIVKEAGMSEEYLFPPIESWN